MNQAADPPGTDPANTGGYAGEVSVARLWDELGASPGAALVDVRTRAEWSFVGVPELSGLGKSPVLVEWQTFPAMEVNPGFAAAVDAAVPDRDAPLFLLCRSGARSRAAAAALTAAGRTRCYNVTEGFEGPPDGRGHRGGVSGWKAHGLPWVQS